MKKRVISHHFLRAIVETKKIRKMHNKNVKVYNTYINSHFMKIETENYFLWLFNLRENVFGY